MATPELRHMLRDDDLNHEEQKQVLELAINSTTTVSTISRSPDRKASR